MTVRLLNHRLTPRRITGCVRSGRRWHRRTRTHVHDPYAALSRRNPDRDGGHVVGGIRVSPVFGNGVEDRVDDLARRRRSMLANDATQPRRAELLSILA